METEPVPRFLVTLGVKHADKKINDFFRLVLVFGLAYIFVRVISSEREPKPQLEDMTSIIKPGSIMYNAVAEMDDDVRCQFIKGIRSTVKSPQPMASKMSKSVGIALGTSLLSEYIVNGNLTKPLNVVAKTVLFATINAFLT